MRFFFFTLFVSFLFSVNAQNNLPKIDSLGFELHSIDDKNGKIEYLVSKNRGDNSPKPIILFCQGSLPKPLIINTPRGVAGVFPFNHTLYTDRFRFVIISKPGIPVMPDFSSLDERYNYREEGEFPSAYLENYFLDRFTERANKVVKEIQKASYSNGEIILMGHSEGARVGAKVAARNKRISKFAYLSANPYGRENGILFAERMKMIQGRMSAEENQEIINQRYEWFRQSDSPDHISFSEGHMDELLNLKIPIFVGYGTRDLGALLCDFIPLEFTKAKKNNLSFHPYINMEHNFFSLKEDGNVDYNAYNWDQIMKDIIFWIDQ